MKSANQVTVYSL